MAAMATGRVSVCWAGAVALVGVVAGCEFGPGLSAGFDSPDPGARLHAVGETVREGDRGGLDELVDELESDDPAARMLSIAALERMTGERLGYEADGPESERAEAVERWRGYVARVQGGIGGGGEGSSGSGGAKEPGLKGR
jgi:hypothetical protein